MKFNIAKMLNIGQQVLKFILQFIRLILYVELLFN